MSDIYSIGSNIPLGIPQKIEQIVQLQNRIAQLEADLADARKDQARYQYVIDWLESNVIATAAFTHARTKSEYDQAIDAAIKEQGK